MTSLVDANLNETKFEYGQYGLLSKQIDPLGNFQLFEYNENEKISKKVLRSGKEISYSYDLRSRLLGVSSFDDNIAYEYFDNDKISTVTRNGFVVSYNYRDSGQLDTESSDFYNKPLKYTYNDRGFVETKSFGEKINFEYFYDKRGALSQITLTTKFGVQKSFNWVRGRDIIGRPIEDISFNDMLTTYSYSDLDQVMHLENLDQQDELISRFDYEYSKRGNITSKTESLGLGDESISTFEFLYKYDKSSRLTESSFENLYGLDPLGNRVGSGYLHNANNQLLESPEWTFTYDLDGNLLQKVHKEKDIVYNYTWSTLGKLTQLDIDEDSMPSKSLMFKYDGLDRRIEKQFVDFKNSKNSYTKRFVYDGEDIILELDGNNTVKALFVHGEGIDDPLMMIRDENDNQIFEDKEVYAYTKDHLGSIREIIDYNGETKQRYSYSSYGETKIAKVNPKDDFIDSPYAYTSRELDLESGDMFYRARYYSPSEGRFVSEDPIGLISGDLNPYRYVHNRPILLVDPSGNIVVTGTTVVAGAALSGGIVGGVAGFLSSNSCSVLGKIGDGLIGATIGAAGGVVAAIGSVGSIVSGAALGIKGTLAVTLGGIAAGAGASALSVFGPSSSGGSCGCP